MQQALQRPLERPVDDRERQVCSHCIMDTSDPAITFDEDGVCNHCRNYERVARELLHGDAARHALERIISTIKAAGKGKDYDCVVGVSGGVDSTFVAYTARTLGLRPLAVHMDNGWDSELAVSNIEKVLKRLDIDLYTYVLDWEEFKDLQLSFLKASVSDAEIPTDHAIAAVIYRVAVEQGVSYLISGANHVTEGILPATWTYGVLDWRYIKAVHKRFGSVPLHNFPHCPLRRWLYHNSVKKIRSVRILDYLPFVKQDAMRVLQEEFGWQYYGGKHYESIYTRFFQGYILPRKFNIDKRKAHLSTLICSGQITRAQALAEMQNDPYPLKMQQEDREYVIKKLGLDDSDFDSIMALPVRTHAAYPTSERPLRILRALYRAARKIGLAPTIGQPLG